MDEFYSNVLQARVDPITSSIPPPDKSLKTPSFTSTHQNQMTVVEVNEYSDIQLVQSFLSKSFYYYVLLTLY